jgi:hypothetical protein
MSHRSRPRLIPIPCAEDLDAGRSVGAAPLARADSASTTTPITLEPIPVAESADVIPLDAELGGAVPCLDASDAAETVVAPGLHAPALVPELVYRPSAARQGEARAEAVTALARALAPARSALARVRRSSSGRGRRGGSAVGFRAEVRAVFGDLFDG